MNEPQDIGVEESLASQVTIQAARIEKQEGEIQQMKVKLEEFGKRQEKLESLVEKQKDLIAVLT